MEGELTLQPELWSGPEGAAQPHLDDGDGVVDDENGLGETPFGASLFKADRYRFDGCLDLCRCASGNEGAHAEHEAESQ